MTRALLLLPLLLGACQEAPVPMPSAARGIQLTLPIAEAPAGPVGPQAPPAAESTGPADPQPTDAPPQVVPPAASGGGGAIAPAPATFGGRVIGLDPAGEQAVGGARVTLSDGRATLSDGAGAFRFDGEPPADGAYAVTHPAYVGSAVIGLEGDEVALHLQPRLAVLPGAQAPMEATWQVEGHVLGPDGRPVSRARVVLRDARGSVGGPAITDDDGRFEMRVQGVEGRVEAGSLLIKGIDDDTVLIGALGGLALAPGGAPLPAVTLQAATHPVRFALDTSRAPGQARYTVTAVGAGGERVTLASDGPTVAIAPLAGVRYSVDCAVRDDAAGAASEWHREDLAPDFAAAETVVTGSLLAPPTVVAAPALTPGAAIAWEPVDGATGYSLSVFGLAGQGPMWEGFTPKAAMTVPPFGHAGPGAYRLVVTAWDRPGLGARHVASLGTRRLRLLPWPDARDARRAMRWLPLIGEQANP